MDSKNISNNSQRNKFSVQISKPLFKAYLISLITIVITAIVFISVMIAAPNSPLHKLLDFLRLNNFNPVANSTSYVIQIDAQLQMIDVFLASPLCMLVGGVAFGILLPLATWPVKRALKTAFLSGFTMAVIVLIAGLLFTDIAQMMSNTPADHFAIAKVPIALAQCAVYALVFALGARLGTALRHTPKANKTIAASASRKQPA